ncbi:NHLP bacteriocin system secretion protein [Legionella nagasakiensis]|uniref:NHLP bacteriocin system secretion protein n=1 Tax=Legionella nagasakiensis TaxID=535290 RepID=UPI00105552BF|nr:NHLP bacteriocin system secretion protein [Legionella nagasakiensis]
MAKLFREKSLERLNDPERLDQIFRIVSPLNWVILAVLLTLLIAGLIWGFFGSIATRVHGNGILVSRGQQIYDAVSQTEGRIAAILVRVGDTVKKGQPVAQLELPVQELELTNKKEELAGLKNQLEELNQFVAKDLHLLREQNKELQENWQKDLQNANLHLKFLQEAIEAREKLVGRGTISRQEMADLKSRYYKELQERDAIANKMTQNKIETQRHIEQNQERLRQLRNTILRTAHEYVAMKRRIQVTSTVKSPVAGIVIEVIGKPGHIVKHGEILVDIEGFAEIIDAAIYVPAAEGKNIRQGMVAHVVPTTVKKQEYGSIIGRVVFVSRFPSSEAGMMGVLANEQLVRDFAKTGPQLFARVDLVEANTPSGYQWTSSRGPDLEISNGTLCTVEVTTKTQAPITLIIPALKHLLGVD